MEPFGIVMQCRQNNAFSPGSSMLTITIKPTVSVFISNKRNGKYQVWIEELPLPQCLAFLWLCCLKPEHRYVFILWKIHFTTWLIQATVTKHDKLSSWKSNLQRWVVLPSYHAIYFNNPFIWWRLNSHCVRKGGKPTSRQGNNILRTDH